MVPFIPKPPITPKQKAAALAVAGLADALQLIIMPLTVAGAFSPVDDLIDFVTAAVLIAICGFKWQFILAFLLELVPALDLFPTWTAAVLLMPTSHDPVAGDVQRVLTPPIATRSGQIDVTATVVPPIQPNSTQVQS